MISFLYDGSIGGGTLAILVASLAIALGFEFVNGFHDTANAVATVIYTKALAPRTAVFWSGLCNFCGVYLGGTAVAFSVVNLLPVDLLIEAGAGRGLAMVMALLISAIAWNLGTWYLGLPASSSHTLIGAILGVGLAHAGPRGVSWGKAGEVGLSLLASPAVGFSLAALLLLGLKRVVRDPGLYRPPPGDRPPPLWIRSVLVLTCTGVSFAHGSNDGQKGIGLIMLILIGILPARYALNAEADARELGRAVASARDLEVLLARHEEVAGVPELRRELAAVRAALEGRGRLREIPEAERWQVRTNLLRIVKGLDALARRGGAGLSRDERAAIRGDRLRLARLTEYAPSWVLVAVATALGVGTTVGWRRIVETVGEKIGKAHLSYAQGACAELVAMSTIGLADLGGLPVSTTHVLSSGIAGTMAANRSGLQWDTVRNIALAWLLTLPASMALSAALFLLFRLGVR
jgi:phosphate/sulfate permease